MNDTELLKFLLGHMLVTSDKDLDWPFNEMVNGLKDSGAEPEMVDALIKRRSEFYKEKDQLVGEGKVDQKEIKRR